MDFSQRLIELRESRGLKQEQLASDIGKSKSLICMYESGKRRPPCEVQELLADYFNVSLDYLMGRDDVYSVIVKPTTQLAHRIPVYGTVSAGIPLEMVEDILDYEEIPAKWGDPSDFFCLQIKGKSMQPKMDEGDVVVVKKQADADSNDIVIFTVNGENASCKRLKKSEHGLAFIPLNTSYDPLIYSWDQVKELPVQILGKVVELRAKF